MFKGLLLSAFVFSNLAFAQDVYRLCGHIPMITKYTPQHVQQTGFAIQIQMNGCQSLPIWNPNWSFLLPASIVDEGMVTDVEQKIGQYACINYTVSQNMEYIFQSFSKVDKENKPVDPNYNCGE